MKQGTFDFSIWERSLAHKKEESEELRHSVLMKLDNAINALSKKYSWHEVFIFGSVIRKGAFHENSDVDIGIEGLDPLKHYAFVGEISGLMECDVDVVLL
jgi:predicted nucleotidyltransferase